MLLCWRVIALIFAWFSQLLLQSANTDKFIKKKVFKILPENDEFLNRKN